MKKLILLGGNQISGAEIVLKDYLIKTKNEFKMITSLENYKTRYYEMNNVDVLGKKELSAIGAEKNILKKMYKVLNVIRMTIFLNKYILKNNIQKIITNNTIDVLYLSFLNLKKISVISFIHDILVKNSIQSRIILKNDKKIKKYIVVSLACKKSLIDIGISECKIELIYNGVDLKKIDISKKNENSFIFVGMINERKNPLEYIKFIEFVSKNITNYSSKVIYKHFEPKLLNKMKEEVNQKNLKVDFLENLSREEVQQIMSQTKYLFICSEKDPLPTVVLEGMNNSMLIIGKNVDGIPEMISNKTGILYNTNEEFFEIVQNLSNLSIEEYQEKIIKGHEVIKRKFNNEVKVNKVDLLIENI